MGRFSSFVIFAEMRTGSNFLEANLNAFDGITCHGEAFNLNFIGYPNNDPILGVDLEMRDADPFKLLFALQRSEGQLRGFRYFHDHDPRIFDTLMDDPACAKIILTRNPVDSYVSWKIAQATGQWKLSDVKAHRSAQIDFEGVEFETYLETIKDFQMKLLSRLQTSGQTGFYLAYEDLQNLDVINGLARFLGVEERLEALDKSLKKQNPTSVSEKVRNAYEMQVALSRVDAFALGRTPNFEPRRGPNVPSYVAAAESGLLYLPLRGGPVAEVVEWLAALDGVTPDDLRRKMTQKDLRQWKRQHPGHRSFTVIRHPVQRAHDAFCRYILSVGPGSYAQIRRALIRRYKLPLPESGPDETWDLTEHRAAFAAFLRFLKGNLSGQTAIRVDGAWCTQAQALAGFGELAFPDRIVREADLTRELAQLACLTGQTEIPELKPAAPDWPFALSDVYNDEIEALAADAYQRDYVNFGFTRWRQAA